MTEIAALVLAHADPVHLKRLIAAIDDVPVFLHCDARTSRDVAGDMTRGLPTRVTVCDRIATRRASWSLVEAELAGLRRLIKASTARHIAVLSGMDYPLVSMQEIVDELGRWDGQSYFRNVRIPFPQWSTKAHPDGGLWRLRHRFVTVKGQVVYWRGIPLRWPRRRDIPPELEPRASSQWKIYARDHVRMLLDIVEARPDLVRFWRSTLVPDESFAASMLGSRVLFGSHAMPPCLAHPWFMSWPPAGSHPRWLESADFEDLSDARWARPVDPVTVLGGTGTYTLSHRRLFARKFSTDVDTGILDRIDDELRR